MDALKWTPSLYGWRCDHFWFPIYSASPLFLSFHDCCFRRLRFLLLRLPRRLILSHATAGHGPAKLLHRVATTAFVSLFSFIFFFVVLVVVVGRRVVIFIVDIAFPTPTTSSSIVSNLVGKGVA